MDNISICVCTYKRPLYLDYLINKFQRLIINELEVSMTIVDNDKDETAKHIVDKYSSKSNIPINYIVEPNKNIALARNKAIQNSKGSLIAFLDDDEFPVDTWLIELYTTFCKYKVNGVLGPVEPFFTEETPEWLKRSDLCKRPSFNTGTFLLPHQCRTGNVLLQKSIFSEQENFFDPKFGLIGGEDTDFFKRMTKKGYKFVWSNEAIAYEHIPLNRQSRTYYIKRAFLRGYSTSIQNQLKTNSLLKSKLIGKSLLAITVYSGKLPLTLIFKNSKMMDLLVRMFHHTGNIFGYLKVLSNVKRV